MKLSTSTQILADRFGDAKAIELLAKAGFDCFDFAFSKGCRCLQDDYAAYAEDLKKEMARNQIFCNQAHAPFEFNNMHRRDTMDLSNHNYLNVVRSIEAAAILGAKHIVVHCIGPAVSPDFWEYNYRYYKSLEPYCQKFGIKIAIENLYDWTEFSDYYSGRLGSPSEIKKLLTMLNSDCFGVCVDTGHAAMVGWKPEDFIRSFDNKQLIALHIHDNDCRVDLHGLPYTLPYVLKLNWDNITKALADIRYAGEFTMESLSFQSSFDNDLIFDAVKFEERVGRKLISKIEHMKKETA